MNRKGTLRIVTTNITKNFFKILLREGFIKNARKHQERNKYLLNSRWNGNCNSFYLTRYNDESGGSTRRNWRRNFMLYMVHLDNEDLILGYVLGRIRRSSIRILQGDRVMIEVSRYDSMRGRIIYRLHNKDLND
ncbi:Translation initiation factor IF-1 chloroplastic [Bienertia sinuspersici]